MKKDSGLDLDEVVVVVGEILVYSQEDLEEFKTLLLSQLEIAKRDLSVEKELVLGNNHGDNSHKLNDDSSSRACSNEVNSELVRRQQKKIENINRALVRIENKTYGICFQSKKLIPKARLLASPFTTSCIEVKQARR